jgi:hypothetical protein
MPASTNIQSALAKVRDRASLFDELLSTTLHWPDLEHVQRLEDIGYGWTAEELRAQSLDAHLLKGQVWQIPPRRRDQPWGVFFLEFTHDKVYRTVLRQVLRGLVPSRQRDSSLPSWQHENLLFICTSSGYERFTFARFRGDKAQTAKLSTFGWQRGSSRLRTVCEFCLPRLDWPTDDGIDANAWVKQWKKAFDKEPLTKDFFKRFDAAIAAMQADLVENQKLTESEAYSRSQLLAERLERLTI